MLDAEGRAQPVHQGASCQYGMPRKVVPSTVQQVGASDLCAKERPHRHGLRSRRMHKETGQRVIFLAAAIDIFASGITANRFRRPVKSDQRYRRRPPESRSRHIFPGHRRTHSKSVLRLRGGQVWSGRSIGAHLLGA